jgi:NADPH2:quinone reductase
MSANSGDDIAGTIYKMGENVLASGEFSVGDRVAAFHPMFTPGGAYAEYALAPQSTILKLPVAVSFEGEQTSP